MDAKSTVYQRFFFDTRSVLTSLLLITLTALWTAAVYAGPGAEAAKKMDDYYQKTVDNCGAERPAYLCSGLMLRGTQHSEKYFIWNPSPTSVANGGASFSYLRKDAKYDRLGLLNYNGYAVKPADEVTLPEKKLNVVCFFPIDAWTDTRDQQGCGDNSTTVTKEFFCNKINVLTSQQWFTNYTQVGKKRPNVCAFDVRETSKSEAVNAFNQGLRAMGLLGAEGFSRQNEIRVATWAQNVPEELPILAFIYTRKLALASAKADQSDFYNKTGKWIPVINLDLPNVPVADAKFTYKPDDQAVAESNSACMPFIENAVWTTTVNKELGKNVAQLIITPSACGRAFSPAQADAAFDELTARFREKGKWGAYNDDSMKLQFLCLRQNYPNNATWNIEPIRPYVSAEEETRTRCNPYQTDIPVETPQQIVERINKNYNQKHSSNNPCKEDKSGNLRGHYYCDGVTLRTVDDGKFTPWSYSPNAKKIGSTSFSWIRADFNTPKLYHAAGFILRTPADDIAKGLIPFDIGWECLYPYDASTSPRHGFRGCDFINDDVQNPATQSNAVNRNSANVYGSCGELNISNSIEWLNYASKNPIPICSFEAESPQGWDAMITLQNNFHPSRSTPQGNAWETRRAITPWNELLLKNKTVVDSDLAQFIVPHIDAVFYDISKPDGLATARNFQSKIQIDGYPIVPIVRVNFTAPPQNRFSYQPSDQLPNSCETYFESSTWVPYTELDNVPAYFLKAVPSECLKRQTPRPLDMAFGELRRLHRNDPEWDEQHSLGMRNQLTCLAMKKPNGSDWPIKPSYNNFPLEYLIQRNCSSK
ncbi:DUF2599 domain-containing protein [Pseudomonas sp.]|uniref:DUF2599 domain-containing protein n=1 Tax=Pseudomonas sp. TaxID=306 RepID=UPI00263257E6|nr:DUF2599 domain-containing protein [Pseudomonas sp.]